MQMFYKDKGVFLTGGTGFFGKSKLSIQNVSCIIDVNRGVSLQVDSIRFLCLLNASILTN